MYGGLMNDASGVGTGQRIGALGVDVRTCMLLYYHNFRFDARFFWVRTPFSLLSLCASSARIPALLSFL